MTPDPLDLLRQPVAPLDPRPEFTAELRRRLEHELRPPTPPGGDMTTTFSTTTPHIPQRLNALTPYLAVDDARAAMRWYQEVFEATLENEPIAMDDGRIGHCELRIGDSRARPAVTRWHDRVVHRARSRRRHRARPRPRGWRPVRATARRGLRLPLGLGCRPLGPPVEHRHRPRGAPGPSAALVDVTEIHARRAKPSRRRKGRQRATRRRRASRSPARRGRGARCRRSDASPPGTRGPRDLRSRSAPT